MFNILILRALAGYCVGVYLALIEIASTPVRVAGELGKDLKSIGDDEADESDGILAIGTCGISSAVKGIVKSLEKAGKELDR